MFDFLETFLLKVSSRSRRRLRDVPISCGDVAKTNFVRDWRDVYATSPRPLETCWRPRRLRRRCGDCRRRRGDIPATSGELVVTLSGDVSDVALVRAQAIFWSLESPRLISLGSLGDVSLVRAQAIFWSPESPELPRLISRGDVSANEIGP